MGGVYLTHQYESTGRSNYPDRFLGFISSFASFGRPRILEARLNLPDASEAHLTVAVCLHLRSCVFVKAACGKTARAVWAADGGQRLTARLLRPDNQNDCVDYGEMKNFLGAISRR